MSFRIIGLFLCAATILVTGCASKPATIISFQSHYSDAPSCRKLFTPGDKAGAIVCGTPFEWDEMGEMIALATTSESCQQTASGKLCMSEELWLHYAAGLQGQDPTFSMDQARADTNMLGDALYSRGLLATQ